MKGQVDLQGGVFGRLTVQAKVRHRGGVAWRCMCSCGNMTIVPTGSLTRGGTKSCGCFRRELRPRLRHGHTINFHRSPEHVSWTGMLERCLNPNNRLYPEYGGRGISICERWMIFENFLADMGLRPKGTTIDRFPNNDGDYEPGNCRWATPKEQARNTRVTLFVELAGEEISLRELAETIGIKYGTMYHRVVISGWSIDQAIQKKDGRDRRAVTVDLQTVRQMQAEGLSRRTIAARLGVSPGTIHNRLKAAS